MIHLPRHLLTRSIRPLGMVLLALVVSWLAAPGAEGSCGDWLEGHATMSGGDDAAVGVGEAPIVAGERTLRPPQPGRRPCNGPSCGRAPAHVPFGPVETPVVPIDLERDAILSSVSVDGTQGLGVLIAFDEPILPTAISGRPERPPKAG